MAKLTCDPPAHWIALRCVVGSPLRLLGGGNLKYRADIDGLRAVAVLSVVWFHYEAALPLWAQLSGGFTGVDVFFVISGFLITQQLYADVQNGQFSIVNFYDRRVRRILPALLAMLGIILLAGRWMLMPGDYALLAASTEAASFGASNFYFLHNTGYFDQSAELMPLLHTWSLAVEEQFYLAWPLLLFGLYKLCPRDKIARITAAIVTIGFGAMIVWTSIDPKGAFYTVAPRAWELAMGALLAFLPPLPRRTGEAAAAVGLTLILGGFVVARAASFPGPSALLPCVGAAAVIWPRTSTSKVGDLLSALRPIGLISYSLYLWHWPVWVFFRIYINNGIPRISEAAALFAVSIALAAASYFLIEQPFRRIRWTPTVPSKLGLTSCVALFCAAQLIHGKEGFTGHLPPGLYAMRNLQVMWDWPCQMSAKIQGPNNSYCFFGARWETSNDRVMIWGDSHAEHFAPLIKTAAPKDMAFVLYTNCPAIFGDKTMIPNTAMPTYQQYCADQRAAGMKLLHDDISIKTVILASSWVYLPRNIQAAYGGDGLARFADELREFLNEASTPGRRFILIGSVPQLDATTLERSRQQFTNVLYRRPSIDKGAKFDRAAGGTSATDIVISAIASERSDTTAVIPSLAMCQNNRCLLSLDDEPLYRDVVHIRRNLSGRTKNDLGKLIGLDQALEHERPDLRRASQP